MSVTPFRKGQDARRGVRSGVRGPIYSTLRRRIISVLPGQIGLGWDALLASVRQGNPLAVIAGVALLALAMRYPDLRESD